ncbi:MAG TPA: hypothetical protein VLG37_02705 [Candidatus Saccharimonadales bacterium]|nr:hypothetical protein [Candidatus Saccharimonadales bacterium]
MVNQQRGSQSYKRPSRTAKSLVLLLIWLALVGLLLANRQNILDWWQLRGYQPPASVAQVAGADGLSAYARKVFYVNHPNIDEKSSFTKFCPNNGGEHTIVLGCYHSNQRGIDLLSVADPRLNGVEQVTAAHEMLHAAYDRLSSKDRQYVDGLLNDYYRHNLDDQRVKDLIGVYQRTEPNDLVNEMHSIFGTEIANLPPALEAYYQRYFLNRSQIVAFATAYKTEFTSRQAAIKQYDVQLADLKVQIDADETDLRVKRATLDAQEKQLNQYKNSGNFAAHDALVPTFNSLANSFNTEADQLRALLKQYNQIVAARNAIVLEQEELNNEISSQVSPIN